MTAKIIKCYLSIVQEILIQVTKPETHIAGVLGLNHGQDSGLKVFAVLLSSSRPGALNLFCAMDPSDSLVKPMDPFLEKFMSRHKIK